MINEVIQKNLADVRADIRKACLRVGRDPGEVRLVAVTKYAEWEWVEALANSHLVFGENRPQQLSERQAKMPNAEWHLIGQLQRNKAKLAVEHATVIHSVDSLRLLQRISVVAEELGRQPQVLLQVNVSGEESKSGFTPTQLRADWPNVVTCHKQVELAGMMTMAPASDIPEDARTTFRALTELRNELAATPEATEQGIRLPELSMGMSGDFEVAIEEGATLIRVGSRLFDGLRTSIQN